MARTMVDTWFFEGELCAEEVMERIGSERATLASRLAFEDVRAAARRIYQVQDGLGVFFIHYYAARDRLEGLPFALWSDRDAQYISDIAEIRRAIANATGEDEGTLFPSPSDAFLRAAGRPASPRPTDCSLRGGLFSENVRSLSDALDGQIAEFAASRFLPSVPVVRTMVFRAAVAG